MRSARTHFACSLLWMILIVLTARSVYAGDQPQPAPDSRAPSVLEEALADYACGSHGSKTINAARYECIGDRIAELRAAFGYDLEHLSAAERRGIDARCGRYRTAEGSDAYIPCVNRELTTLRAKTGQGDLTTAAVSAPSPGMNGPAAASPERRLRATWLALGVAFGAIGWLAAKRMKASRRRCRTCGAKMPPPGDLCADCRKRAAEALRQAAGERADRERAAQEERRRRDEQQEQLARAESEARLRREQEERQRAAEQERREREAAARRAEAQAEQAAATGAEDESSETFDPYTVLGVARDARHSAVVAAYEQARAKYDPELVEHLGEEVQEHFRTKAQAVERAYQLLAEWTTI